MHPRPPLLTGVLAVALSTLAGAQGPVDTTLTAPAAEVWAREGAPPRLTPGRRNWSAADLRAAGARSVAELLDGEAGVHVRHYGPGALASASLRGGSAAQSVAVWNGVPLASPSLGQLDWALLPLGALGAEAVALERGGASARWGSGAVGGVVSARSQRPPAGWSAGAALAGGAFGEREAEAAVGYGGARLRGRTRVLHGRARNDFAFRPAPGLPKQSQANAAAERVHLRQDFYLDTRRGDRYSAHYWRAATAREIPPTVTQSISVAAQRDRADRLALGHRRDRPAYALELTAGYADESLRFTDARAGVDSRGAFATAYAEAAAELKGAWRGLRLATAYTGTRVTVDGGYPDGRRRRQVATRLRYRRTLGPLDVDAGLRQELVDGALVPLSPRLQLDYRLGLAVALTARASRDFRLPSLNDLYWQPGGNPALRPERGWSQELGVAYARGATELTAAAYHRHLRDYILWGIAPGESFWSASNLTAVRTTGLELRARQRWGLGAAATLSVAGGLDYVRAANQTPLELPSLARGDQLWYVPRWAGFAEARLRRRDWLLRYRHRLRGASPGINDQVPASATADLRLGYAGPRLGGFAEVRNLGDADYRLIERRPLPGRHLRAGLSLRLGALAPDPPPTP